MDRIEIFRGKINSKTKFQLRITINNPIYGQITLYSDIYDNIAEADCRCVALARTLNLDRDHLPVVDGVIALFESECQGQSCGV